MKQVVYKYPLNETCNPQTLQMPEGAITLDVQLQNGQLNLWALVNPDAPLEDHTFLIKGTGHDFEVEDHRQALDYISTVQVGALVWHIFQLWNL